MLAWAWPIEFERPWWLLCALAVPLLILLSRRSLAGLEASRRWSGMSVRSAVWLGVVVALAGATFLRENKNLSVLFVLDRSRSIPETLLRRQESYIRTACDSLPPDDKVGVVSFAGQSNIEQLPSRGGIHTEQFAPPTDPERTNISQALQMAMATFPRDTAQRIVLLSDGNENVGDVMGDALTAAAAGVAVDVLPMRYAHENEVYFDRMVVPSQAYEDEEVPIRLVIRSRMETSGRIMLFKDGRPIDLDPASDEIGQRVNLNAGVNALQLQYPLRGVRVHRFEARFVPDEAADDAIPQNNLATGLTVVAGGTRVLLVTAEPDADAPLFDALSREGIDVTMQRIEETQIDLVELESYATVILSNLPANLFSDDQQEALAVYVRDLGGGLIMTGGNEAFGAGGWIGSPVEEVMPVDFDVKDKKIIPRGALVIINHTCELPRGNYWGEQVALKAVDTISTRDYLGVLAYTWTRGVDWEIPLQIASNKPAIRNKIKQMQIGDMPDFAETMELAVRQLNKTDASQKHIIIISDGDASPPSNRTLVAMKNARITCSTVAIGYGAHVMEATLRDIAKRTGGRFYACRNPNQLPQIFTKESKIVRRSLINETPFRPVVEFGLSEILSGLGTSDLPLLKGIVITTPKPLAEVPLVKPTKEGRDPLLAYWHSGLGRSVVFTSGWWPYWGSEWSSWPAFGKFWAQTVRWAMRQSEAANFEVNTRVEGKRGTVTIEATGDDAAFQNFLEFRGFAIDPELKRAPIRLVQTGPGRYEGEFDVGKNGQYLLNLQYGMPGERPKALRAGLSVPYSAEYRELRTNDALLSRIQEAGGRWLSGDPLTDEVFAHNLPPSISRQPVWEWIVAWLVLPLFLTDVAIRRLASPAAVSVFVEIVVFVFLMFGVGVAYGPWWGWLGALIFTEMVGWSIRFRSVGPTIEFLTYTVATLSRTGEARAQAMSQLRRAREDVRERLDAGERPLQRRVEPRPTAGEKKRGRFDAGSEMGESAPAEDLSEAMGGAAKDTPASAARAGSQRDPKEEIEPTDVRSRLLKAKRKAQDEIDKKGK